MDGCNWRPYVVVGFGIMAAESLHAVTRDNSTIDVA